MKTDSDILTILFTEAKAYTDINSLNGGIYKKTRPLNSTKEDCVLTTIQGTLRKFVQDGAIQIKLFYNDLKLSDGTFAEDTKRGGELQSILYSFSEVLLRKNLGIYFNVETREVYTDEVIELDQHFAILKINYELLN